MSDPEMDRLRRDFEDLDRRLTGLIHDRKMKKRLGPDHGPQFKWWSEFMSSNGMSDVLRVQDLIESYRDFCVNRMGTQPALNAVWFGKFMTKVLPPTARRALRVIDGHKVAVLVLPPPEECRAYFKEHFNDRI